MNSLHGQGLDRLAERLAVEATAPDGTIEAVSVQGAGAFALGVQWHPEFRVQENPHSRRLFGAFGEACRARRAARRHPQQDDRPRRHRHDDRDPDHDHDHDDQHRRPHALAEGA